MKRKLTLSILFLVCYIDRIMNNSTHASIWLFLPQFLIKIHTLVEKLDFSLVMFSRFNVQKSLHFLTSLHSDLPPSNPQPLNKTKSVSLRNHFFSFIVTLMKKLCTHLNHYFKNGFKFLLNYLLLKIFWRTLVTKQLMAPIHFHRKKNTVWLHTFFTMYSIVFNRRKKLVKIRNNMRVNYKSPAD